MEISGYGYRCAAGESFDLVALSLFGDEKYAAELISVNPEYTGRLVFDGTEFLRIPVIDLPDEDAADEAGLTSAAPWKE